MKKILATICTYIFLFESAFAAEWFEDDPVEFPDSFGSSNGIVSMTGELLDHDIVKISTKISDIQTPVLGVAFHLKYDPSSLAFLRYDPGNFLETGGDPFYLVSGDSKGTLVFGETLRRDDSFPLGDGVLASFYFQRIGDKSDEKIYSFEFEKGVVSTLDTVRQDIDHVVFENFILESSDNNLSDDTADNTEASVSSVFFSSGFSTFDLFIVLGCAFVGIIVAFFFLRFSGKKYRI